MPVREFLNATDFSRPEEAMDLYSNSVRRRMQYDSFGDKTVFEAIILSRPFYLVDAQITDEGDVQTRRNTEEGRLSKFAFKARILGNPSPHDYLPDPCKMNGATVEEQRAIMRVVNLHTTFVSSDDYTRSSEGLPNVGDKVRVELEKNVHSYNLQFGKFVGLADNNVGAPLTDAELCASTRTIFGGAAANSALGAAAPVLSETSFATRPEDLLAPGHTVGSSSGADWGYRELPPGRYKWHNGVDIQNVRGNPPAYSLCNGVVMDVYPRSGQSLCVAPDPCVDAGFSGCCGGGRGNFVRIKCTSEIKAGLGAGSHSVQFSHLYSVTAGIEVGTKVIIGMQIGQVGNTGASLGDHIHFEFWGNNSRTVLSPDGTSTTREPDTTGGWTTAQIQAAEAAGTPEHDLDDPFAIPTPIPSSWPTGRDRPNRFIIIMKEWFNKFIAGTPQSNTYSVEWYNNCKSKLAGKATKEAINSVLEDAVDFTMPKMYSEIACKEAT